jgi:hypothetical protein
MTTVNAHIQVILSSKGRRVEKRRKMINGEKFSKLKRPIWETNRCKKEQVGRREGNAMINFYAEVFQFIFNVRQSLIFQVELHLNCRYFDSYLPPMVFRKMASEATAVSLKAYCLQ